MRVFAFLAVTAALLGCDAVIAQDLSNTHREENDIWLNGGLIETIEDPALKLGEGYAMVCGMKHRSSTLSIRSAPDAGSKEVLTAPYYAVLGITGKLSADKAWAEVSTVWITHDTHAHRLPKDRYTDVSGWAATRYLCNFTD